ncbi:MAG TPA: argininosuccinate lyase, partial [Verrucomicrobiae bacterium]|nr:argininosuccinate lyase [Verrucomicrobiae bacterium]
GMPFRKAHKIVGSLVALAERKKHPLNRFTLEEFRAVDPIFDRDVLGVFDLQKAMRGRNLLGAPGTREVQKQLAQWAKKLG